MSLMHHLPPPPMFLGHLSVDCQLHDAVSRKNNAVAYVHDVGLSPTVLFRFNLRPLINDLMMERQGHRLFSVLDGCL